MSRRCELTGKSAQVGHKVSHSNIKTKRRFLPNLLNVTMISDALGRSVRLRVSANALKSVDHRGGLDAYLAKARANGAKGDAALAIETYFTEISARIRMVERSRLAAEPSHLESLKAFAERAFRRPLSRGESDDLIAFYDDLRRKDGLSHEDAIRDSVASVLLSPYFCYCSDEAEPGTAPRPLSAYALASRLSYFLWSSLPDAELLAHDEFRSLREEPRGKRIQRERYRFCHVHAFSHRPRRVEHAA